MWLGLLSFIALKDSYLWYLAMLTDFSYVSQKLLFIKLADHSEWFHLVTLAVEKQDSRRAE